MAMRSIVCLFDGTEHEFSALDTAITISRHNLGHLKIIHPFRPLSSAMRRSVGAYVLNDEVWEAIRDSHERWMANAREKAAEIVKNHQLLLNASDTDLPRVSFVQLEEDGDDLRQLSLCDLIVVGASLDDDFFSRPGAETALMRSGRPVLLVRARASGGSAKVLGGGCAVLWNGSVEAIRTLINAQEVLEGAREVFLIVTEKAGASGDQISAARDYLVAHGIDPRLELVEQCADVPLAEVVLERVRELRCDVIAMGAYGHSAFRETVLGGFSRHMLQNSEIPLLMCH